MRRFYLDLARRHTKTCEAKLPVYSFTKEPTTPAERKADQCTCPILISNGYLPGEPNKIKNISIGATDWTAANEIKIGYLKDGRLPARAAVVASKIMAAGEVTIKYAVDAYKAYYTADGSPVGHDTQREYTKFFDFRLLPWCAANGIERLKELENLDPVHRFYDTWINLKTGEKLDRDTKGKLVAHFRTFLSWCMDRGGETKWITYNAAKKLGTKKAAADHWLDDSNSNGNEDNGNRIGLTVAEYKRVVAALDSLPSGIESDRLRAFVQLLRWSGMRLSDGILFSNDKLQMNSDGSYVANFIQTKLRKHGEKARCIVPLPEHVVKMLRALPFMQGKYWFLPPGIKNPKSFWSSKVLAIFAAAQSEIPFAHPCTIHNLRHTYAVTKLNIAHADIRHVSKWLGHFTLETTMDHYSNENADEIRLRAEAAKIVMEREVAL